MGISSLNASTPVGASSSASVRGATTSPSGTTGFTPSATSSSCIPSRLASASRTSSSRSLSSSLISASSTACRSNSFVSSSIPTFSGIPSALLVLLLSLMNCSISSLVLTEYLSTFREARSPRTICALAIA